ncbi:ferritin-like domain-containing protein [Belnapia sp. T6]|uniref:Ferritin-like domain-containing protein n=1 Tax=Belnapia mucosa TaxID=2804532 RepID=A0ABS1V8V0_9PROT|nr:ferritin-like domain-containing protein [Belnapia mucosa]MBL6457174.1 ferritin-like domain-containing protein [Belnapia mucosa]
MADTIKDLLELSLQDTYSAENQILAALPELEEAATSPKLKQAFREHREQTERQVERLEEVCQMLGIEPDGETCAAMEGLVEESDDLMEELEAGPVLDAALIGAAQKVEHYEMAAYGTLCSMLKSMGQTKAVDLLSQTLKEEKDTDELLTTIAESEVNPAALQTLPANEQLGGSRGAA